MAVHSAGILLFRRHADKLEVLLVHPSGPFWARKDTWSIPKGELDQDEDHLAAARREFAEEVGIELPAGEFIDLGSEKQHNAKVNFIWAMEADPDLTGFHSNNFEMEWPPKSGKVQEFPEVDRAEWFSPEAAKAKLFESQCVFIDRLCEKLDL